MRTDSRHSRPRSKRETTSSFNSDTMMLARLIARSTMDVQLVRPSITNIVRLARPLSSKLYFLFSVFHVEVRKLTPNDKQQWQTRNSPNILHLPGPSLKTPQKQRRQCHHSLSNAQQPLRQRNLQIQTKHFRQICRRRRQSRRRDLHRPRQRDVCAISEHDRQSRRLVLSGCDALHSGGSEGYRA